MRVPDWTNLYSIESSGPVMRTSRPVSSATSRRAVASVVSSGSGVPFGSVQVRCRRGHVDGCRRRAAHVRRRTGRRSRPRKWRWRSSGVPRSRGGAGTSARSGTPGASPVHRHQRPDSAIAQMRPYGSGTAPARAESLVGAGIRALAACLGAAAGLNDARAPRPSRRSRRRLDGRTNRAAGRAAYLAAMLCPMGGNGTGSVLPCKRIAE